MQTALMDAMSTAGDDGNHSDKPMEWTYSEAVDKVGAGRYQVVLLGLLIVVSCTTAANNSSNIYLGAHMNHVCKTPNFTTNGSHNTTSYVTDTCTLTTITTIQDDHNRTNTSVTEQCTEWLYTSTLYKRTLMSEWNLNSCPGQGKWKIAFSSSMYMIGFLVGCIVLGDLSDRFGRHLILVLSAAGMVLSGVGAAFSVNLVMFVIMRFLLGIFTAGARNSAYVAIAEISPSRWRTVSAVLPGFAYLLGDMLNTLVIYLIRDWRWYQFATSISFVWFLLYWWLIPESPRWLLVMGRQKEVINYFRRSARINRKELPKNLLIRLGCDNEKSEPLLSLVKTKHLRLTSFSIWTLWFIVSIVTFSMQFNVGNIGDNIYLNSLIMSSIALPLNLLGLLYIRVGRRLATFTTFVACVIMSVVLACTQPGAAKVILAAIGIAFPGYAFNFLYVITSELYPTVARVTALGVASSSARAGGALAPYVVLSNDLWPALPYVIMAGLSVIASVIAFFLPETMNKPLPDSLQDAEKSSRLHATCHFIRPCSKYSPEQKK